MKDELKACNKISKIDGQPKCPKSLNTQCLNHGRIWNEKSENHGQTRESKKGIEVIVQSWMSKYIYIYIINLFIER